MGKLPIEAATDLVNFSIKSGGSYIKDSYQVLSIKIKRSVNQIPYCEIEIVDGNPTEEDFSVSNAATFIPGKEIEVLVGYANKKETVFKGIITKHSIRISKARGAVLVVSCKDKAVKMTISRKNAHFKNKKDSDIIGEIIGQYDLDLELPNTIHQPQEIIQYYATDWDFIVTRADVNGLVVAVLDGKVIVLDPEKSNKQELTLTYGTDIYDLDMEMDAETQVKSVQTTAWNIKKQTLNSGKAALSKTQIGNLTGSKLAEAVGSKAFKLQSAGFLEPSSLATWAKAKTTKSKFAKIRGTVKFPGSALAKIGDLIELKGVSKRFNGKGFIAGVSHDIQDGNWITSLEIGLNPEWYATTVKSEAPMASGLLPGVQGLQIGIVQQIHDDPDGEFRVLVKLPLMQSNKAGVWARLAANYATVGAGSFFYPEIKDEVVVGFFNNDPRFPVIVGSLYSSSHATPESVSKKNNLKAFVSREQMKITFEEEKKIITISTPANNQLIFSDDEKSISMIDQHNNSIRLSENGIEINSTSDIQIKAEQAVTIDGPTGITHRSTGGTISLEGNSINCSADIEFKATANASLSVSSSGVVSINGAIVNIN